MKKIIILMGAVALLATSCTQYSYMATGGTASKTGEASRKIFLGLAFGHTEAGIEAAAKNGNITKVATCDFSVKRGLFVTTVKTVVTGE